MTDRLRDAYDPERFRAQGHQLIDSLADYLANMQHDPAPGVCSPGSCPTTGWKTGKLITKRPPMRK